MSKSLTEQRIPGFFWKSHFFTPTLAAWGSLQLRPQGLGCGRLRSRQAGWAWGGPGPSLPYRPPPRVPPVLTPRRPPSSLIPAGPGFLLHGHGWASPLPDVPLPPPPPDTAPPCCPARSARAPSWRTWVSGVRVPLSPSPSPLLEPASPSWGPLALPASLHPCLPGLLASGLCRRLLSDSTSPFLPLPSLPLPDWSLPPLLPSLCSPVAGCIRMNEVQSLQAPGLGSSGKEELKGPGSRDWESSRERRQ